MRTGTTHYKSGASLRLPTIVTRKGQITIPAPIRDALGIKEGDTISVALEGHEVKLEPVWPRDRIAVRNGQSSG